MLGTDPVLGVVGGGEAGKQINGFVAHKVVLILAGHLGSKIIHFAVSTY